MYNYFSPICQGHIIKKELILTHEELEALRLKDLEELEQEECAKKMEVSQPTFHRLIKDARKKVASALIEGHALKIEGGNFAMIGETMKKQCACIKCGLVIEKELGIPCRKLACPKCGSRMIRK